MLREDYLEGDKIDVDNCKYIKLFLELGYKFI